MKRTFITVTEDCLIEMVMSGLEAYAVRHSSKSIRGENRLETYGLLWGARSSLASGNTMYTVNMMSIDTSAKRSNGSVEPKDSAISLKRDIMTGYWPTRVLLGDFHTHPYDPKEADFRDIEKQRLYDFSQQDHLTVEGGDNPWRSWGYRVGLVLTITHLKGQSTIVPSRISDSAIRFALGSYRLWLKGCLARDTRSGLKVYDDDADALYLDCPALLGLDGCFHDGLKHSNE